MRYQFRQAPFARLLLPLVAGILVQHFFHFPAWIIYPLAALVFLVLLFFKKSGLADQYFTTRSFGFIVYACIFFIGTGLAEHAEVFPHEPATRSGTICMIPERSGTSYRVVLDRLYEYTGDQQTRLEGKVLVYLRGPVDSTLLSPGNRVVFFSSLDTIPRSRNPMSFDARRYYNQKKIFWKAYPARGKAMIVKYHDHRLTIMAQRYRMRLIYLLNSCELMYPEIITALLTGYRKGLDEKEQRIFADSGAMHIMAVSGLHTGLVYGMLSLILSVFFRRQRFIRLLLPLPVVWAFALITGLSPSVSRAALMITLFATEACLNRQKNYYNVLFFSAFLLVVINPGILFEVSFQLSFTAVFGIVSCFIPAYRRCKTGRYIPDRISGLLLLSAVAQLFTFPLSAYYFHQFPVYFLLANLLVVPLVPLVIYTAVFLIVSQFLPSVLALATYALNMLSGSLLRIVERVSSLPFSVVHDIYFRPIEVLLFYVLILSVTAWLKQKLAVFLFPGIVAVIFLAGTDLFDHVVQYNQQKIHVYHSRPGWVCDIIDGKDHIVLVNDTTRDFRSRLHRQLRTYWLSLGVKEHVFLDANNISRYKMKNICICRSSEIDGLVIIRTGWCRIGILSACHREIAAAGSTLKLDYLFLCGKGRFRLDHMLHFIEPEVVIIDRNVTYRQSIRWERVCRARNIPVHSVYKNGYFIKEL